MKAIAINGSPRRNWNTIICSFSTAVQNILLQQITINLKIIKIMLHLILMKSIRRQ